MSVLTVQGIGVSVRDVTVTEGVKVFVAVEVGEDVKVGVAEAVTVRVLVFVAGMRLGV